MTYFDPVKAQYELDWLKANPQFIERPATILEFLGVGYLNIESKIRPGIKEALIEIFGTEVQTTQIAQKQRAMVTGAIGIGKTTIASICLPYMVHWVLCLRDPQDFFGLLPGSRIAFMQMSTNEKQAIEVIFGDIKARIAHSEWFQQNAVIDEKFTKQIRFSGKDIWILPGDSAETTFEGYNILGGILDEMDSHKVTNDKDYAESGYDTIHARITSRFGNRGLLVLIGQMKKATGFAARKYEEYQTDSEAFVCKMTIWESFGWDKYLAPDGTHDSFFYDHKRKRIIEKMAVSLLTPENTTTLLEVPNTYRKDFLNNPVKALRDLAGMPPKVSDPFIPLVDRIEECREAWIARHGDESPVLDNTSTLLFQPWFTSQDDTRPRVLHLDNAYSAAGDGLGIAMGYVEEMIKTDDDELKPLIVFDFIARVKASPGSEIMFSDIRRVIYRLKEDLGFRLKKVTMDGFQSVDTQQQLRKKRFQVEEVSVDKKTGPYEDLREAIYERRVEFPPYITYFNAGDEKPVEIAVKELSELTSDYRKVDHPVGGSKDVADAMAGVVYTLMGERSYRRGARKLDIERRLGNTDPNREVASTDSFADIMKAAQRAGGGLQAPRPPLNATGRGISVPQHLRPTR